MCPPGGGDCINNGCLLIPPPPMAMARQQCPGWHSCFILHYYVSGSRLALLRQQLPPNTSPLLSVSDEGEGALDGCPRQHWPGRDPAGPARAGPAGRLRAGHPLLPQAGGERRPGFPLAPPRTATAGRVVRGGGGGPGPSNAVSLSHRHTRYSPKLLNFTPDLLLSPTAGESKGNSNATPFCTKQSRKESQSESLHCGDCKKQKRPAKRKQEQKNKRFFRNLKNACPEEECSVSGHQGPGGAGCTPRPAVPRPILRHLRLEAGRPWRRLTARRFLFIPVNQREHWRLLLVYDLPGQPGPRGSAMGVGGCFFFKPETFKEFLRFFFLRHRLALISNPAHTP